jgi:hypothetical protein
MDIQPTHNNTLCTCTYGLECNTLTQEQIEGIAPLPMVRVIHIYPTSGCVLSRGGAPTLTGVSTSGRVHNTGGFSVG